MNRPTDPILYSFRRCPFAMRARLALAISRTTFELREVRLAAKPAELLAKSPKGTVPILVLPDGKVIDESLDIMGWALKNADPEGWLDRVDDELIAENDGPFKHDLDRYKYSERNTDSSLAHRERGVKFLRKLDRHLSGGNWLAGSLRGLTDAAIFPFVRQFASVDRGWFEAQSLSCLQPWLDQYGRSDLFQSIMQRVPAWSPAVGPVDISFDHEPRL